jgi:N utilization substance protein A
MEVPEIADSIVEIKNVARDPGFRCKIAVDSKDSDVDPIGACVGMKGSRVQSVVQELRGEKIDIVAWDEDPARFVCNAIAPAEVVKVIVKENTKTMEVVVPDDQLSLAIGKRGQNVRLAAELCGWNIDILSETKIEELSRRHQRALVELLGATTEAAFVLYTHGYRGMEEIQGTAKEEFLNVPGITEAALAELHDKASSLVAEGKTTAEVVAGIAAEEDAIKAEEEAKAAEEAAKAEEEAKAAEEVAKAEEEAKAAEEAAEEDSAPVEEGAETEEGAGEKVDAPEQEPTIEEEYVPEEGKEDSEEETK